MPSEARTLARQACLLVIITASLVIGGIALLHGVLSPHREALLTLVTPLGAISAIACGVGLLACLRPWHVLRGVCALVLLAIGGHSLLVAAGINVLPWPELGRQGVWVPFPIVGGVLVVLALCLWHGPRPGWACWLWRVVGACLVLLGCGLMLMQWSTLAIQMVTRHPMPSSGGSLSIFLLGMVMLVAATSAAEEPRIRWSGWAAGVLGVALSTLSWYYLSLEHTQGILRHNQVVVGQVQQAVNQMLWSDIRLLERLQDTGRRGRQAGEPQGPHDEDADALMRDFSGLQMLALVAPDGQIPWRRGLNPEAFAWLDKLHEPSMRAWLEQPSVQPQVAVLQQLLPGLEGPAQLLVRLPMIGEAPTLLAVFDFATWLKTGMHTSIAPFRFVLETAAGKEVVLGGQGLPLEPVLFTSETWLQLPFGPVVRVVCYLDDSKTLNQASRLRQAMLLMGLLFSFLLVVTVELSRVMVSRNRLLLSSQATLESQGRIAEQIAGGAALGCVCEQISTLVEANVPESRAAVFEHDAGSQRLRLLAAGSLPEEMHEALRHLKQEPWWLAAGQAWRSGEAVIVANLDEQPVPTEGPSSLPVECGLLAVWSFPVSDARGNVLGVLEVYRTVPGGPDRSVSSVLEQACRLAGLAIERQRDHRLIAASEQRYRSLFTYNPDAVFALDPLGRFTDANDSACRILGMDIEALRGRHYADVIRADDWSGTLRPFSEAMDGKPHRYEFVVKDSRGRPSIFDITNLPIVIDGRVTGVHGIAKDITEKRRHEAEMQLLLRSVEASSNGIMVANACEPELPIEYVNPAFERITGYQRHDILGRNARLLQGQGTAPEALEQIRAGLAAEREVHTTLLNYRKDGRAFWNDLYIAPVRDDRGQVTHFIGVQNDISNLKAQEAQLAHHAHHDALTGLPNRKLLQDQLDASCQAARRVGGNLAVVFIDLDGFKPINDSLGHAIGDFILIEVASRLAALVEPGDTVARFGGDEFVLVVNGLSSPEALTPLLDQVLATISRGYSHERNELFITASLGVVFSDGQVADATELIRQADMAMYRAKEQGRNNYQWFTREINERLLREVALRNDLQNAIDHSQFSLHYQPLFDIHGAVHSAEALLRWQHPTLGAVSPAQFISLAEETGQIIPIGDWVIGQVCRDLNALGLPRGLRVSINVSPVQFHRPDFVPHLMSLLREHGVAADHLELELTEGVLLDDEAGAVSRLHQLRGLGVAVSIDDFGTGFSSLSYLKNLPIDRVKIDRSFVRDVVTDAKDAAITRGIIAMAHQLGLEVVAEGVETEAQRRFLIDHGCNLLQGFHLCRPGPLAQLRELLWPRSAD